MLILLKGVVEVRIKPVFVLLLTDLGLFDSLGRLPSIKVVPALIIEITYSLWSACFGCE